MPFDSDGVAKRLFFLRERHPEGYEAFEEAVYTLFPEFEVFSVDPYEVKDEWKERYAGFVEAGEGGELPFHLRDELYRITIKSVFLNQPVDISRMSAGTKRTVWLLANTITALALGDQMLGIEEIETSIHPRMAGPEGKHAFGVAFMMEGVTEKVLQGLRAASRYEAWFVLRGADHKRHSCFRPQ